MKKDKLKDGTEVHYYSFWDSEKYIIFLSLAAALLSGFFYSSALELLIGEFIGAFILLNFGRSFLRTMRIIQEKIINTSISYICPKCDNKVWYTVPQIRMTCPNCKEEVGFDDNKVYKITKENEKYFNTEQEKTNILLEKQLNDNADKSNLAQIKELKELLDMGAITQEEYDKKKKELLDRS